MHSLQTNYDFILSVIHYPYWKTTSKLIPFNKHKFQISNKNKDARRQLSGEYAYEQQNKSIPSCFDSSKHDVYIKCYKKFTMSSKIARRKSEGEETSTLNKTKRVQRSVECAKQFFPNECRISIYSGANKIKCKKSFPHLLTLQTSPDAIVRFTNVKKDGEILKIVSHGKLLEREFMDHGKCYREYTRLPKDETVR